jgi:DNA-binding CsgD family transcriptional regulator
MLKLFIKRVSHDTHENSAPSFPGIISSGEPEIIAKNSDYQDGSEAICLDLLVADSRYDEIKKFASDKDCNLHLSLFSYPVKDSNISKNSVKAIRTLTKTQRHILKELATKDPFEIIAKRNYRSLATIKSHVQDIYETLNVSKRYEAVSAYHLFLLEYPEEALADPVKTKPNKNKKHESFKI